MTSLSRVSYDPSWGLRPTPPVDEMTTYAMFARSARHHPQKPALIFLDRSISYRALDDEVGRFAAALANFGIKAGDRVGVVLPNCPQHIIAFLAANRLGAIHVPANVMYGPEELRYIFEDAGIRLVVTLDLFFENVKAAAADTAVERIVVTGIDDFLGFPQNLLYRVKSRLDGSRPKVAFGKNIHRYLDLLNTGGPAPAPTAEVDFDATMMILYTAGTTGKSKGVMLTHRNFVYNAANQAENFAMTPEDINLVLFPLFHISGYLLATICMFYDGGTTILEPRFDARRYVRILDKYRVTIFFAPPTVYIAFLALPDLDRYDLSALRISGASGAPVPQAIQARWRQRTNLDLLNGYGLTETTAGAIVSLPNKYNLDALGVPLGGEVKIADSQGRPVPIGERGEIWFRGPQVAKGYWNKPGETAKTFVDGWLRTGDIGTMDEDGFLYFVDREKDLIIASAYNIAPADVESVLLRHPAIQEVAVIGVPDEYRGETVKAFVVLADAYRGKVTEADIIAYGKANMAAYKYPRQVEFIDQLPKSPIQKVLRKQLRDMEAARRKG
ncbi:MAG: long-chain fatty acid--CoA ligase [Desulfobacteraceae bacterium]|nr:long-chain fatty acid--CoA ligase [Desulfobacteraceae bacterium]